MTADISAIADRFVAAYNAGDPGAVAALYARDGWHGDAATGHRNSGPEAIGKGLAHFLAAIPDAHWSETGRVAAGRSMLVLYRLDGHLDGRLGPFGGIGQPIRLSGAFALSADGEGRLISSLDYWDPRDFARQARLEGGRTDRTEGESA